MPLSESTIGRRGVRGRPTHRAARRPPPLATPFRSPASHTRRQPSCARRIRPTFWVAPRRVPTSRPLWPAGGDEARACPTRSPARWARRSVQATAFTHGADIYFGERSYSPGTAAGQRLLAHELAHTQQSGGSAHVGGPVIGRAADPAEADADRVADGVLRAMRRQTLRRRIQTDLARPQPRLVRRTALRILRVLDRDAIVVRGGTNLAEQFTNGSGVTAADDGKLSGVSVNSGNAKTFDQLCAGIPNGSVGTTTVGAIRDLTGDVVEAPTRNKLHCLAAGLTGAEFSGLLTPTVKNPAAVP